MKKFILPALVLAVVIGSALEATAGCGGRLLGNRNCGSRERILGNRGCSAHSCGSSRVSSCGSASKVSSCAECATASKEAAGNPAPAKVAK